MISKHNLTNTNASGITWKENPFIKLIKLLPKAINSSTTIPIILLDVVVNGIKF